MPAFAPLVCAVLLCAGCIGSPRDGAAPTTRPLQIAFVAGVDGYVYTVAADGSRLRRLTRGHEWGAASIAWSPDGTRLAVVSTNVRESARYSSNLLMMEAGGARRQRVARLVRSESTLRWRKGDTLEVLDYAWPNRAMVTRVRLHDGRTRPTGEEPNGPLSPDGRRRALVKGEPPREDSQIYVARPDGSRAVNVSRSRSVGPSRLLETAPAWSPDGRRLAYVVDRGRGTDVWVMNADGSRERRVASAPLVRAGPEWSRDGRFLAYQADADDDGLDELYVADAKGGGPARKLVEMEYIADLEWRPAGARPRIVPTPYPRPAPRRPVRTYTYELGAGGARLADVRLLRRFASDETRPVLADVSPDGSLVAFFERRELGVLDLRRNRVRRIARSRTPRAESQALFSPNGRRLLFRRWDRLLTADVSTGRLRSVARSASGAFAWLEDGRVVFVADGGRLTIVRPGADGRPLAGVPTVDRFAITPDGRRILYDRRCETFLLDRRTGARRRLSGHLFVPARAWAPDGSFFVLQRAEECNRRDGAIWAYHSSDELFASNGKKVATSPGRGATWTRDSRLLFAYPHPTGSGVAGLESLVVIDPRRRRQSTLLREGNAYSEAFVGPGGWVVFTKYGRPELVRNGYTAGGLYLARIVGG